MPPFYNKPNTLWGPPVIKTPEDRNVTLYAFIAAFGGFVFGLDAANISGVVRFVSAQFELDSWQTGLVVSCAIVGVIIALFFAGTFCEKFGRKRVLIAIAVAYSLSTIISSLAINYPMLIFGRFIGGVAFASITVSAMYIGEIAPSDKRGSFVSLSQLLITLGSLVAFTVNYYLVVAMGNVDWIHNENVWRIMLGFELIANAIWVAALLVIPESPRWLIKKGSEADARQIFAKIAHPADIEKTIVDIHQSIDDDAKKDPVAQLKLLFSGPMSFIVLIAVCYAVVQGATGMNAVLFFAPTVFEQIGMSLEDTFAQTISLGAIAVVFTIVAILFVEKWGRRVLTLTGLALIALAHTSIWYGFESADYTLDADALVRIQALDVDISKLQAFEGTTYKDDVALKVDLATIYGRNELPLVSGTIINATISITPGFVLFGLFAFLAAFNMSIGPIMWVIFSEVFPNSVRSVALPFAALVQSISSVSIQQLFPWQLESLGAATTFLTYGVIAVIGLIVMAFILPETRNKSIEELEQILVRR